MLSYVEPDKAAAVISRLDEKRQVQMVESMTKIESVSPVAVKIIEAEIRKKFSSIVTSSNGKVGGIDYVADVMNNIDRTSEKNIFDGLSAYDQELADEIRKRMFVFEDIITMDDRSVQRFVHIYISECDAKRLTQIPASLSAALSALSDRVRIIPMSDNESGTCIIEMPDEIVDASASTQLDNLRTILMDTTNSASGINLFH